MLIDLSEILDALPTKTVVGRPDTDFSTIVHDSRSVTPGDIFVAIIEPSGRDGHLYISDAIARGASVVIQEKGEALKGVTTVTVPDTSIALGQMAAAFHGNPADDLKLIGVTGTNGKSTTISFHRIFIVHTLCGSLGISKRILLSLRGR